jgi:uncharacterized protein (DUF433 family)
MCLQLNQTTARGARNSFCTTDDIHLGEDRLHMDFTVPSLINSVDRFLVWLASMRSPTRVKLLLATSSLMNYPAKMSTGELLKRITIDPGICHGKPCIRVLRYPVAMLLELMSSGMSHDEILADYEDLEREDLLAALAYAARVSAAKRVALVE